MLTGLVIALVGVLLVVLASGKQVRFQPMAALVLVCVLVTAVFFVAQKPLFARNSMLGVTAFTFFAGTLGALPFAGGLGAALRAAPWSHVAALLYLGIAPTFVGYLAWNAALRRVPASQMATFLYLSPPIALLIGWLWLHEQPGLLTLVGGVITLAGVALANTRRRTLPDMPPMSIPRKLR
jgi:drug/metabolite transporter (DMT)-like permease